MTTNPRPNFKMGIEEIKVDPGQQSSEGRDLNRIAPEVGPGEQVSLQCSHARSRRTPGQRRSLARSERPGDALAAAAQLRPDPGLLLLRAHPGRLDVGAAGVSVDDYNAEIQKNLPAGRFQGSGGGKGEGDLGVVEVRQDFPDTAFWDAQWSPTRTAKPT